MAGIYIHIPFCSKRCTYCDFYTEVAPDLIPDLVKHLVKEINIRKDYLKNETISTIYFGGGTPSILSREQFSEILDGIFAVYTVEENAEITFEANPDDLTVDFFDSIKYLPFNRISIGIQSFDDNDLKRINRRHTADQAIKAVKNAQNAGFDNISIDLIYGLPLQSIEDWEKQLDIALSLNIQHVSAYGLTYEEGTALWKQREKGLVKPIIDETMNEMYLLLVKKMKEKGFEAYEISNFALDGFRSKHNSSYWKQNSYLGIGPSAHSYDLVSRQWNVASIKAYIAALENNTPYFEKEELTLYDRYNDYVMVSLRTSDGLDFDFLSSEFGQNLASYFLDNIRIYIENNSVIQSDGKYSLTPQGIMISNQILIQLIKV
ncbi:oxygen-independent coproporphyrinogen III oxidase [Paludibacter propionicigenes WB4]|uniref:Heme chaperone HemW n=1 Tax=Paludibacter propionicigenes (strain DSM 17365 / JCM 13257 / WB4) TaxID=694427 RepID=E4T218_PALPW|nr:radical SAM family heme chaperone HemW [Paludibacter propionicigenes]ADQ78762.1 oxygen-independent coproporphyrinogen III oxidase [Paludibacter propionicigenes WB4]